MILAIGFFLAGTGALALAVYAIVTISDADIEPKILKFIGWMGGAFIIGMMLMIIHATMEIWQKASLS